MITRVGFQPRSGAAGMLVLLLLDGGTKFVGTLY